MKKKAHELAGSVQTQHQSSQEMCRMTISLDELRDAVGRKLAQLLKNDEAGWYNAACWIDKIALNKGIEFSG
jgi:hypothetical protein